MLRADHPARPGTRWRCRCSTAWCRRCRRCSRPPRAPARRFGVVYMPNGMMMPNWTPADRRRRLRAVADARAARAVPRRADRPERPEQQAARNSPAGAAAGDHARASTRFLTGVPPKRAQGSEISAGISIDQIAAQEFGKETQLASLELALEGRDFAGACDVGYSCAYTNTISWRSADDAAADGERSARGVRAAVRRRRQHRSGGAADAASRPTAASSIRSPSGIADLQRRSGRATARKLASTSKRSATSSGASRRRRSRAAGSCRSVEQPAGVPAAFEDTPS